MEVDTVTRKAALIAVAATGLLVAGCGSLDNAGGGGSTTLTTSAQPSTTQQQPSTSSAPSTRSGPGKCTTGELSGKLTPGSPGAGQRYAELVLTNTGNATCTIYGYGGLELLGANRSALPTHLTRTPNPGPTTVTLAPGHSASKNLHWSAVPGDGDAQTGDCQPNPSAISVIPPDETHALRVAWSLGSVCERGSIEGSAYHS